MKKHIYIFSAAALSLLAFNACTKEELNGGNDINSDLVSFSIDVSKHLNNNGSGSQTKSGGDLVLLNDEGDSLNLSLSISDDFSLVNTASTQMIETKGTVITPSNFLDQVSQIGLYGFYNNKSTPYIGSRETYSKSDGSTGKRIKFNLGETLKKTGNHTDETYKSCWASEKNYYWPKVGSLDFWAWAPADIIAKAENNTESADKSSNVTISSLSISNADKYLKFKYYLGKSDATAQPDLMFASNIGVTQSSASAAEAGHVALDFKHALSAIKFNITADGGGTIKKITLSNVLKKAYCVYKSDDTFTWTVIDATKDYKGSYSHTFNASPESGKYNLYAGDNSSAVFMMIPQTLEADKQKVTFTIDYGTGTDVEYSGYLKQSIDAWEAGKVYTYTVKILDGSIDFTVDDTVTETVKSDVVIKNTGEAYGYVRATIVANWVNNAGRYVSSWKSSDGEFKDLCTGDWVKSGDYYYYKLEVAPGATVPALFDTYTVKTTKEGVHLEMDIVVQAISAIGYKDYKDAWKKAAGLDL